jgi:hypothetical protein
VRSEASGDLALESVRALVRFHRIQASPGLDQAAEWLATRLSTIGLRPEIDRVPGDGRTRFLGQLMPQGWECDRATAILHGAGGPTPLCDVEAAPLSVIQRSAHTRGRWPLVWVEGGSEERDYANVEVRGRVILTEGDVHRVHQLGVLERGAQGLLAFGRRLAPPVRTAEDELDAINYTSFWWGEHDPRGWGFVVSTRVGRELRASLAAGESLELEAEIESRAFDTSIPLVSAVLPGDGTRSDEILVLSHLCHPQPSANDNASGVAANLETARTLKTLRDSGALPAGPRGIRFLWMPEFTGTYAWLDRRFQTKGSAGVSAALNLDMVGEDQEQCGSTLLIERPPHFMGSFAETLLARIRDAAPDWVESFSGPGHFSMMRMAQVPYSGGSDHVVLMDPAIGAPSPMLIQWPDRYYHSSHDTPDRCSPASLALAARCAATWAGFLAGAREPELEWLLEAVAREARVRLIEAGKERHAVERMRGDAALASVARFAGDDARTSDAVTAARRAFSEFAEREGDGSTDGRRNRQPGRTPRRRLGAPLHYQRRLIAGYDQLPLRIREAWRLLENDPGSLATAFDVAWFACDGIRDVEEIALRVRDETGADARPQIEEFFEWTAQLGLSEWV